MSSEIQAEIEEITIELAECREDDRNSQNQVVQVIATCGAILGMIYTASVFAISQNPSDESAILLQNKHLLLWASCFVFIVAYSYLISLGQLGVLRFHYLRDMEDKLAKLQGRDPEKMQLVGWPNLSASILTRIRSHLETVYSKIYFGVYSLVPVFACIFSIFIIWAQFDHIEYPGIMDYLCICVLLLIVLSSIVVFIWISSRAKDMYDKALQQALRRKKERFRSEIQNNDSNHKKKRRNWFSVVMYFLYPKLKDMQKPMLIVIGFFTGIYLEKGSFAHLTISEITTLTIALIVIDLLVYQARFQWNDIRGFSEDQKRGVTGRLPIDVLGKTGAVFCSLGIMLFKVVAAYIISFFAGSITVQLVTCITIIIGYSIVYEILRTLKWNKAIFCLVGIGYPLRIFAGMWIAYPTIGSNTYSAAVILLLIAYYFLGIYSVTLAWAHEALQDKPITEFAASKSYLWYLYKMLKDRDPKSKPYQLALHKKGAITDWWNWTYLASMVILSSATILVRPVNPFGAIETILVLMSLGLCLSSHPMSFCYLAILMVSAIIKIWFSSSFMSPPLMILGLNQIFFTFMYWFLRMLFSLEFSLKTELWKLLAIIIGPDSFREIVDELKSKSDSKAK